MADNPTIRLRRPSKHRVLIKELVESNGMHMRDILLIAAGIGFKHGIAEKFEDSDEKIRLEIFDKGAAPTFMSLLAITPRVEDKEFSNEEIEDFYLNRFEIFEEYACGGLSWIQEQARLKEIQASQILMDEVEITLLDSDSTVEDEISDLLGVDAF